MLLSAARTRGGLLNRGADARERIAEWVMKIFEKKVDFDTIIKALTGDEYFDKNKRDIAKIEKTTKKSVLELWDDDPVFTKFPNLRSLARNREFEKMWAKMKNKSR
jgi:hypothetical protein